jgi:hypothetical protein
MKNFLLIAALLLIGLVAHAETIQGVVTRVFEMAEGDHSLMVRIQEKNKKIPTLLVLRDDNAQFIKIHELLTASSTKHLEGAISEEIILSVKLQGSVTVIEKVEKN